MIDKCITNFQENIINASNAFVHRDAGPFSGSNGTISLGRIENRIVMAFSIGFTSLVDYIKLPLAAIEELTKGILLTPMVPFSRDLSKKCFKHYKYAFCYVTQLFSKLVIGTIRDLIVLKVSLLSPHKIPYFIPPSYCGSNKLYNKQYQTQEQKDHPSIPLNMLISIER